VRLNSLILLFIMLLSFNCLVVAQEDQKVEAQAIIEVDSDETLTLNGAKVTWSSLLPMLLDIASQNDTFAIDITYDMAAGHLLFDQLAESYIPIMHMQQVELYHSFIGDPDIFYDDNDVLIKGRVVDKDGNPLSNVNIITSELQKETMSNQFGDFILKVSSNCEYLIFQDSGYQRKKVDLNQEAYLEVVLPQRNRIW